MNFEVFCAKFLEWRKQGLPIVVVTLTGERGHAPQDLGARMVVSQEGILFGTIGGGKIELRCIEEARKMLTDRSALRHQSFTWNLQRDIGMSCGGEVSVLFESFSNEHEWRIALFGAGHIVQELAPLLLKLDCKLSVIDPRAEWLDRIADHSRLTKLHRADMVSVVRELPEDSFVAIITMGHATDYPILREALMHRRFPYLGVIGSKVKRIKIDSELRDDFKRAGLNEGEIAPFHCPMGEDYGKNDPAEIAISIAAQMLATRREGKFISSGRSSEQV